MNKNMVSVKRPENQRMQAFLASYGIECVPKYIRNGSLKGSWRLYNLEMRWTGELADRLNSLGFSDLWGKPLDYLSGNAGLFSVFVRGHNELL